MDEVTWLLIRDSAPDGFGGRHKLLLAEIFGEIGHAIAESLRALGVDGILLQQVTIFLEGGAAARGGDDDGVFAGAFEGIDVLTGENARLFHHPGVNVERAATLLLARDVDVGPVSGYDAGRGAVCVGKYGPHDAAVEQARAAWLVPNRIGQPAFVPGNDRAAGDRGRERLELVHLQQR